MAKNNKWQMMYDSICIWNVCVSCRFKIAPISIQFIIVISILMIFFLFLFYLYANEVLLYFRYPASVPRRKITEKYFVHYFIGNWTHEMYLIKYLIEIIIIEWNEK